MDATVALAALLILLALAKLAALLRDPFGGNLERRKAYEAMPGFTYSMPIIGDLWRTYLPGRTYAQHLLDAFRKLGPTFRFWVGNHPGVVLSRPEDLETVLGSTKFNDKPPLAYKLVESVFGEGLLTLNGEPWRLHRKHITHAFHFRILENYVAIFERKSAMLADKMEPQADGITSFDVFECFAYVANETIFETAFGIDESTNTSIEEERRKGYVDALEFGAYTMLKRFVQPWLLIDWVFALQPDGRRHRANEKLMDSFVDKIIVERRAALAAGKQAGGYFYFLDMMLERGEGDEDGELDDAEIRGELRTFMAVQQTSATIMAFAVIMLALHPDVQRKVVEEIVDVLDRDGITYRSLQSLKYLDRVLKETMRLYPVVPMLGRVTPTDHDVPIVGGALPAGGMAVLSVLGAHRQAEHWPEPLRFDPDRFLPERSAGRHPYAYVPFSAGSRNCIGQKYAMLQMKTVFATLMRRYEALPGRGCASIEEVESRLDMTTFLFLTGGFNVRMRARDRAAGSAASATSAASAASSAASRRPERLGVGQPVRTC